MATLMHFSSFVHVAHQNFVISTSHVRKVLISPGLQLSYMHLVADQNAIGLACYTINLSKIHLQNPNVTNHETVQIRSLIFVAFIIHATNCNKFLHTKFSTSNTVINKKFYYLMQSAILKIK
jgi:hypothetical protein